MSGLFGALVDAARGRAPVLLPRPRPVFAPLDGPALLSPPALDDVDEVPQARRESPAAGRPGRARTGEAAEAIIPERGGDRPDSPPRPNRARSRGPASDQEEAATPSPRRLRAPAIPDLIGPPVAEQRPRVAAAPRIDGLPGVEREDGPGFPPRDHEPLLPPPAEAPFAAPASRDPGGEAQWPGPADSRSPAASIEEASGSPRIDLRIGRIEIVAPAARPAVAKASAHATIVPRARPRQSLDDYLSRRRR